MRTRKPSPLHLYVAAVSVVGLVLLLLVATIGLGDLQLAGVEFWMFFAFAVMGELFPIKVPRGSEEEEITTSTTFVYAIMLSGGTVLAVLAQAVASLVADLGRRKPLWKAAFNVAQATLSLVAARAVLLALADVPRWFATSHLRPDDFVPILLSAVVYFAVNSLLTGFALALAQNVPVFPYLRSDLAFQALTASVLLTLAPVAVIVADFNPYLVPLLGLPIVAAYKSASGSLENSRLVAKLEHSLDQLRVQAAKNEHQATHDALTDLPNRILFHDRVEQALRRSRREGSGAAVLIMDLDHFKEINDTLGHHNGDLLLQQIGARLRGVLRGSDTIARLGGDEFAVLLQDLPEASGAVVVAENLLGALEQPLIIEDLALDVTGSIGIAAFPNHGEDVDTLIQRADVAMYVAKAAHTRYEIYEPFRDQYSPSRLALAGELRRAILEGELVLHYQPKAEFQTGNVTGMEALVRWLHPERGLLLPEDFLAVAEHTGMVRSLASYILDVALGECRRLADAGIHLPVAVNLSARNLSDVNLPHEVASILGKWGLPARALQLEITETSIMADPPRALDVLRRLKAMGVEISIDDFGTGYSSLAFLRSLPVGEIKIDKSFVLNMLVADEDAVIVRSTIDLGRNLGLRVVAEGVESKAIWSRLAELGCDVAQGFYVSGPLPSAKLIQWLDDRTDIVRGPAHENGHRVTAPVASRPERVS